MQFDQANDSVDSSDASDTDEEVIDATADYSSSDESSEELPQEDSQHFDDDVSLAVSTYTTRTGGMAKRYKLN